MALNKNGVDFVLCLKQGNKVEIVVLNRVCILVFFCPKQGQGFKPSAVHPCSNTGRVPLPRVNTMPYNALELALK